MNMAYLIGGDGVKFIQMYKSRWKRLSQEEMERLVENAERIVELVVTDGRSHRDGVRIIYKESSEEE